MPENLNMWGEQIMQNKLKINGDIIIGDPCEMVKSEEDWEICEYGSRMDKLGINNFMCVEYEEDAPDVIDENGNIIGSLCTDSGMIVVTKLIDLLNYDPEFNQHITYPENWTVIKNFNGDIEVRENDDSVQLIGKGNISFFTKTENNE